MHEPLASVLRSRHRRFAFYFFRFLRMSTSPPASRDDKDALPPSQAALLKTHLRAYDAERVQRERAAKEKWHQKATRVATTTVTGMSLLIFGAVVFLLMLLRPAVVCMSSGSAYVPDEVSIVRVITLSFVAAGTFSLLVLAGRRNKASSLEENVETKP